MIECEIEGASHAVSFPVGSGHRVVVPCLSAIFRKSLNRIGAGEG